MAIRKIKRSTLDGYGTSKIWDAVIVRSNDHSIVGYGSVSVWDDYADTWHKIADYNSGRLLAIETLAKLGAISEGE